MNNESTTRHTVVSSDDSVEGRRGLMLVMMEPDEGYEKTLNRWYDEEHLAERLRVPGILSARRFVAVEGGPKYLALYELETPDVLRSQEYVNQKGNPTPLTSEVEAHVTMTRNVYVEITPEPTDVRGPSGT